MAPNIGKMISDAMKKALKPIMKPIMSIIKMIKGLGKTFSNLLKPIMNILKGLGKMFSSMLKPILNILKSLGKMITKLFKKVMGTLTKIISSLKKAFLSIFYYIKCAIERIKNTPKCMIYYVIDIIFFTLLIPVRLLILIFPVLEEFEEMFRETIKKIDTIVHKISLSTIGKGFHINKWPDGVLNKCYRCKAKFENPEGIEDFISKLFEFKGNTKNFLFFFIKSITIIAMSLFLYLFIQKLTKKKTCDPKNNPAVVADALKI
jgi:hypothetical protein